jgi:L-asparaginase
LSASGNRESAREPAIGLYATGGTIASANETGDAIQPTLSAKQLVEVVPGLGSTDRLRVIDFRRVPSVELTATDIVALAARLARDADDGLDGFVVTQGTDTLEEMAFGLDLLWAREHPVVFTGAMRGPNAVGADGPANLSAAIAVASSPAARRAGCLVVMNDEVHAARHVQKAHTTNVAAFRSPLTGPVGAISEGRVRLWSRALCPPRLPCPPSSTPQVPVALVRVALGDDGRGLEALDGQGYRGVVVEAMGGGHVPERLVGPLAALAAKMPVVLASRTGSGEPLRHTYGFPGAEIELLESGLLTAGLLDGLKARVKLTLLLMADATRHEIKTAFEAEDGGQ